LTSQVTIGFSRLTLLHEIMKSLS